MKTSNGTIVRCAECGRKFNNCSQYRIVQGETICRDVQRCRSLVESLRAERPATAKAGAA